MVEKTVDHKVVAVTPKQAEEWLAVNHVNRRIRRKLVEAYRRDMEAGRWQFTGEPIQFSRTGALINGQHRLTALSAAKKVRSIEFLVVTGLPDESQTLMDQGQSRTIRDALVIEHGEVKNVTMVAAICRWMAITDIPGPHFTPSLLRTKVTAAEALAAFEAFPEINEAASRAAWLRNHLLGSGAAMGYCWLAFHRINPSANTEYWKGMVDLEYSYRKDPRKAAYKRINIIHGEQERPASLETAVMMVSVFTRSWNAWRNGDEVDTILVKSRSGLILPVRPI